MASSISSIAQVWQAVYPRLVFAPKSDPWLQTQLRKPSAPLAICSWSLRLPLGLLSNPLEEMSENYSGDIWHVLDCSSWNISSLRFCPNAYISVVGESPQEERRQQLLVPEFHRCCHRRLQDFIQEKLVGTWLTWNLQTEKTGIGHWCYWCAI